MLALSCGGCCVLQNIPEQSRFVLCEHVYDLQRTRTRWRASHIDTRMVAVAVAVVVDVAAWSQACHQKRTTL